MNLPPRYTRVLLAAGVALLLLSFGSIILVVTRDAPRRMRTIDITPPTPTPGELGNRISRAWPRQSKPSVTPSPQRAAKADTYDYATSATTSQEFAPASDIVLNDATTTANNISLRGSISEDDVNENADNLLFSTTVMSYPTPVAYDANDLTGHAPTTTTTPLTSSLHIALTDYQVTPTLVLTFTVSNTSPPTVSVPLTITAIRDTRFGIPTLVHNGDGDSTLIGGEMWLYVITRTKTITDFLRSRTIVTATTPNDDLINNSTIIELYRIDSDSYYSSLYESMIKIGVCDGLIVVSGQYFATTSTIYCWQGSTAYTFSFPHSTPILPIHTKELIELEWPDVVAANRSNFVRISLIQTAEGYTPTVDVIGHEMITGTPRVQATPGLPLAQTFGPDYAGFATAYLEGNAFTIQQVGQAEQSLDQERIDWTWNISSDQLGEQYLNATIQMEWHHKADGDPIQRQAWSSPLAITVKPTFYRLTQEGLFPLITGLLGLILSVPGALFLKQRDTTTAEASDAFLGLPSTLYTRLRMTLLTCAPLESDTALRTLFIDARIAPWRDDLPYVDTPKQRAQTVINFLYAHTNIQGDNALVLFLRVLSEHHDPTDACHANIVSLAAELEPVTHSMVE